MLMGQHLKTVCVVSVQLPVAFRKGLQLEQEGRRDPLAFELGCSQALARETPE